MSKVLVTESNLEDIADAIRAKSNSTSTYTVGEMASAIRSIVGGGGDSLPVGIMVPFGSETPPTNWLVCDGSAVSRTEYADLFAVIGTNYGAGDGSTTFNLPNKKGKLSVGLDSNDVDFNTIGKTGGEKTHVLSIYEMPQHNHAQYLDGNDSNPAGGGAAYDWMISNRRYAYTGGDLAAYSGANQPHNNLQPYEVDCWIIKAVNNSEEDQNGVINITTTGTDLNNYTETGSYYFSVDVTPTNIPAGSNGWLVVLKGDLVNYTHVKQIWYRLGSDPNHHQTFVRTNLNGTWSSWRKYSMEPISLYDNTSGTTGTVTLSKTSADFIRIKIFYGDIGSTYGNKSVEVFSPNGKTANLEISTYTNGYYYAVPEQVLISGTTISVSQAYRFRIKSSDSSITITENATQTKIYKVLGYTN